MCTDECINEYKLNKFKEETVRKLLTPFLLSLLKKVKTRELESGKRKMKYPQNKLGLSVSV